MKWCFLALAALLFTSCATVTGFFIADNYLSVDIPEYAKGFELRQSGEKYILECRTAYKEKQLPSLDKAQYPVEYKFVTAGKKELDRICDGDSLPTVILQKLVINDHDPGFRTGTPLAFKSFGCKENPTFKIVDSGKIKKPAKIGLVASAMAADAALIYAFPLIYVVAVATGTVVGGIAVYIFLSSDMH
jgi:hypothetical protein